MRLNNDAHFHRTIDKFSIGVGLQVSIAENVFGHSAKAEMQGSDPKTGPASSTRFGRIKVNPLDFFAIPLGWRAKRNASSFLIQSVTVSTPHSLTTCRAII